MLRFMCIVLLHMMMTCDLNVMYLGVSIVCVVVYKHLFNATIKGIVHTEIF